MNTSKCPITPASTKIVIRTWHRSSIAPDRDLTTLPDNSTQLRPRRDGKCKAGPFLLMRVMRCMFRRSDLRQWVIVVWIKVRKKKRVGTIWGGKIAVQNTRSQSEARRR